MSDNLLAMHRAFLAEVGRQRADLQKQLDELESVEQYHQRMIDQLEPSRQLPVVPEDRTPEGKAKPEISDARLIAVLRHEACAIALKALGGRAKTQQIVDWLLERGYGQDLETRVFHNTCFTAMKRKKDVFRKVGTGTWELLSKAA